MRNNRKPKIGLLGIMIGAYEPLFPGIIETQRKHVEEIASTLSDYADVVFDGVAFDRAMIEKNVKSYNEQCDGIMIILLAYSHSGWIIKAMQDNRLPIAMAVLQPDDEIKPEFTEYDFTRNQGIHGSQDNANILSRLDIPCQFYVGSRKDKRFFEFFSNFSRAAYVYNYLRSARIAVIGKMTGMGDLFTDDIKLQKILGAEFCYSSIGIIRNLMDEVKDEDINKEITYEKTVFDIDKNMPHEAHAYAVRQYLATKRFLDDNNYEGFTLHFETLGEDGRFTSLPFLAASNLIADGYGYAAEGDALCAVAVLASRLIAGAATFSEMYALDYPTKSILMCHAGEGNWKIARKDRKPKLIYKVFNEGGLDNPPTTLFSPEAGRATIVSFAPSDKGFKIICAVGNITDKCDLKGCEMPYIFFKPDVPMETLLENWLAFGGTHHETVMYGDCREVFRNLASMWKCEYAEF